MKPVSVYVHIPFCTIKCGYCDFNAYAGMDALKPAYRDALLAEIAASRELLAGREIVTVGFGGGTPGEVPAADIASVLDALRSTAPFAAGAEVTFEANPGTASLSQFTALREAGVTRLSLGAQTFDQARLQFLDRIHSVEAVGASVRAARRAGFESVSLDLIYGIPGETLEAFRADIDAALALQPDHISCYALTVEEGTPLARRVSRGEVIMPSDELDADMYELACARLAEEGFEQYELSNWALPGHRSRHNLAYWTDRDYLGIGAGAHGYVDGVRYENIAHPRAYIAAMAKDPAERPIAEVHELDLATRMSDWLALRLRLVEGFDPALFEQRFGRTLQQACGLALERLGRAGILESTPSRLRLSPRGRLLHGEVAATLLRHLEDHPPVVAAPAAP